MKHLENIPDWICKEGDDNICAYVDTDSNYYNASPILNYKFPNFNSLPDIEQDNLCEKVALKYQDLITESYDEMSKRVFNIPSHRFEMKTEAVIRTAYFRAHRRYAQWITKSEGVDVDNIDIKGLEFLKSNFPPILGEFFNGLLKQVLRGATKDEIDKQVVEYKENLLNMEIGKLGNPTRVKTLNNYIEREPGAGEMFSIIGKGAPAAVKAAIRYNDFIRFWKLNNKYDYIVQGDKIRWIYLKPNPYRMEALAFLEHEMPPKIKTELFDKFVDKTKVYESVLKNKIEGFYSDLGWVLEDKKEDKAFSLFFAKDLAT